MFRVIEFRLHLSFMRLSRDRTAQLGTSRWNTANCGIGVIQSNKDQEVERENWIKVTILKGAKSSNRAKGSLILLISYYIQSKEQKLDEKIVKVYTRTEKNVTLALTPEAHQKIHKEIHA